MRIGLSLSLLIFLSTTTPVNFAADFPPIAHVAGFGRSVDANRDVVHHVLAVSFDHGILALRLEGRPTGSGASNWAGMGIGAPVSDDSLLWAVKWQPCLFSGDYELRVVASDSSGNAPALQPILRVSIDGCLVTPVEHVNRSASVWFENRAIDDMGFVHAEVEAPGLNHTMIAVYEGESGALVAERVWLSAPDPDHHDWFVGSFDRSPIHQGGVGRFWVATHDQWTTHLSFGQLTVGCAPPDLNSEVTNEQICARVRVDAGMLSDSTYIALYPTRIAFVDHEDSIGIWPNCAVGDLVTAIWLRGPQDSTHGAQVQVQISYRVPVSDDCLSVERLFPPPDGWQPVLPGWRNGTIGGGIADFQTSIGKLEGIYAVVTDSQFCEQRASLPVSSQLAQNYPNPFNSSTVIPIGLESESDWTLDVFNIMGQHLRTFTGHDGAGWVRVTWDGLDKAGRPAASGIYFYRFTIGDRSETKAMILLK